MRRVLLAIALALTASTVAAPPAFTAFPGANGKIAFATGAGGVGDVAVMDADGGDRVVLTASGLASEPSWSADGSRIAFAMVGPDAWAVFAMDEDGSDRVEITRTGVQPAMIPTWSPGGTRLAYVADHPCCGVGPTELWVVDADGTGAAQVTSDGSPVESHPDWSPDGRRIVFDSAPLGDDQPELELTRELYSVRPDGSGLVQLTTNDASDWGASWSPDGRKLAFASDRDGNFEIYVMGADGTGQTRLTTSAGDDLRPRWSPDGTRIVFETDRDGNSEIYVMDADGSDQTNLTTSPADETSPDWQPLPLRARRIMLGWKERLISGGKAALAFEVTSLAVGARSWAVRASVTNLTGKAIRIRKHFGLALFESAAATEAYAQLSAATYAPKLPKRLAPGQTWKGTFRGTGIMIPGRIVRVAFGTFLAPLVPGRTAVDWLTAASARL
ncbi:MAG: PD40 domain-containing protein [Thermoleophilia bacterium]|nr:PD40 domain-containing protein [Thermoleophilia bacterium]